jgi:DNA-binding SARP family transcriptional activator/TolB-like protein
VTLPESFPIRLQLLGPVSVTRSDGEATRPLLTQPRRLAILAYLAIARPRGLHSRDTLVALLWPESDQSAGRHALRNSLHAIRQALGDEVIVTAGDGLVGADANTIDCDVLALEEDLEAGRVDDALNRYHGELLQGFHVSEAPEFERWLDGERRRIADAVLAGAWRNAADKRAKGDRDGALHAARRASALAPDDELSLRRLLEFLDAGGDRSAALRAYEEFAERLKSDYGAEPSAETQALARALKENPSAADVLAAAPPPRVHVAQASQPRSSRGDSESPIIGRSPFQLRRWWWGVAVVAVVVIAGIFAFARNGDEANAVAPSVGRRLVVLPMENKTGDPNLDYVGSGLAEGVARRLEGIGGITIRSGARSEWPAATRHDFRAIGRQFGALVLLKTTLTKVNDSLEVQASVVDAATSGEKTVATRRFTTDGLRDTESQLAASVAGAVFRVPLPAVPQLPVRAINPESYRLMLEGWHQLLTVRDPKAAGELFVQSTQLDPFNSRAWAGLSSTWSSGGGAGLSVKFDDAFEHAEAAANRALTLDSMDGSAWANLAFNRALKYRNLSVGTELLRRAIAADPSNAEVFLVESALYRHAWEWDKARDAVRIARRLDPLTNYYLDREAAIELCSNHPAAALRVINDELTMDPSDKIAQRARLRTLVLLGRPDEAISLWRAEASAEGNRALADQLGKAHGETGYWAAVHADGRRRLEKVQKQADKSYVSPVTLAQAQLAAGEIDAGFQSLGVAERQREVALYRLPCMPDMDEVRNTPRFAALLKRVGPLPLH